MLSGDVFNRLNDLRLALSSQTHPFRPTKLRKYILAKVFNRHSFVRLLVNISAYARGCGHIELIVLLLLVLLLVQSGVILLSVEVQVGRKQMTVCV